MTAAIHPSYLMQKGISVRFKVLAVHGDQVWKAFMLYQLLRDLSVSAVSMQAQGKEVCITRFLNDSNLASHRLKAMVKGVKMPPISSMVRLHLLLVSCFFQLFWPHLDRP